MRPDRIFNNNSFLSSVAMLAGSTAFAQALTLIALPFLTRLYTPEEYGLLGVFSAFLGVFSVVSCLRYEIAIPLPSEDKEALALVFVSFFSLLVNTFVCLLLLFFFKDFILEKMKAEGLGNYLYLLPLSLFFSGLYSVTQFWCTRTKAFKLVANTRLFQATGGIITQAGFGIAKYGVIGLILGQMVSVGAGFWKMGQQLISDSYKIEGFNGKIVLETAVKYKKFPLFSTMESLVNVAGVQIPLLIINSFVGSGEVGFLMIAMRIMHAPLGLLGSSISQAYFSRAVEEHRSNNLGNFTAKILDNLARFGVGPILLVGLVAPSVFGKLLGHSWARSGEIILWLTPWHVMQYLASPISMSLHVTGNQKLALMLTSFGFGVRLIAVWAGLYSPMGMGIVELFAISGAIFYCLCLLVFCKISGVHIEHFATRFRRFFGLIFLYLVIALSFKLLVEKF